MLGDGQLYLSQLGFVANWSHFMRDTITSLIENYDAKGRYLDLDAVDQLKSYFETGTARVQAKDI